MYLEIVDAYVRVDCVKWEIIPAVYNNSKFYHTHLGFDLILTIQNKSVSPNGRIWDQALEMKTVFMSFS